MGEGPTPLTCYEIDIDCPKTKISREEASVGPTTLFLQVTCILKLYWGKPAHSYQQHSVLCLILGLQRSQQQEGRNFVESTKATLFLETLFLNRDNVRTPFQFIRERQL